MSEFPTPISDDVETQAAEASSPGAVQASDPAPVSPDPQAVDEPVESGRDATSTTDQEPDAAEEAAGEEAPAGPGKAAVLENECEVAADYLEELLDIADLDGDIETFVEGGRAHVSVDTEGDLLVGPDGQVLEALQELSRLAVMTETGHRSRLMLDVAGHREQRRQELQDLTGDAVQEVKDDGEPVRLAPMNPFERKIVHDFVAAAGLRSESEGEEPKRCVVIKAS